MKKKKRVSMYDEEEAEVVKNDYEFQVSCSCSIDVLELTIDVGGRMVQDQC